MPVLDVNELWNIIKVGSGILGTLITGIAGAIWFLSGYKHRLETSEQTISLLKSVVFKDKEGLNILTLDSHKEKCGAIELLFSKDYSNVILKISSLEESVKKIENKLNESKAEKGIEEIKGLLFGLGQHISGGNSEFDRRRITRRTSDMEILSEKKE